MTMSTGNEVQSRRLKALPPNIIFPAFTQGAEALYAGKQPQILMKFALTLRGALS